MPLWDGDVPVVVAPVPEPVVVPVSPPDGALFALDDPDFARPWVLRDVSHYTAEQWIGRYHYLGGMPAGACHRIAAFAPDMVGVVVYAQPTNAHGVAKKYGLTAWPGNIEIARVAVHPSAPRFTTSRLVAAANRVVAATGIAWVFSYADTGAGHHGGIYQAVNAVYVGVSDARPGYLLDGRPFHPRSLVAWVGTQSNEAFRLVAERGHELVKVADMNTRKHCYVLPIGDRRSRRAIIKALAPHTKPYPKRGDA